MTKPQQMLLDVQAPVALTDLQKKDVEATVAKHPEVIPAIREYKDSYIEVADRFRNLCAVLRKADLASAPLINLLQSEGFGNTRISEVKTVVESPQPVFERYMAKMIGMKLALEQAREARGSNLPVTTGKAYDELANAFNRVNVAVFAVKRSRYRFERLGVVYTLTVVRKPVKAARKAKK